MDGAIGDGVGNAEGLGAAERGAVLRLTAAGAFRAAVSGARPGAVATGPQAVPIRPITQAAKKVVPRALNILPPDVKRHRTGKRWKPTAHLPPHRRARRRIRRRRHHPGGEQEGDPGAKKVPPYRHPPTHFPEAVSSMPRNLPIALFVAALVVVIVGVDVLIFRHHVWARLMMNVGLVLVWAAIYVRFLYKA